MELSACHGFAMSCDPPLGSVAVSVCSEQQGHRAPSSGLLFGHTPPHPSEILSGVLFLALEEPFQHSGQIGLGGDEWPNLVLSWEFKVCRTRSGR